MPRNGRLNGFHAGGRKGYFWTLGLKMEFQVSLILGSSEGRECRERKKHIKNKTRKQNLHGIVPGFWGEFCLCVFSPPKE